MKKISRRAITLLLISASFLSAQKSSFPPQSALTQLRKGEACVSLFAGIDTPEELRNLKKKKEKGQTRFYRGKSEIISFPAEITVEIHMFAGCQAEGPWFKNPPAWPSFANELKFEFFWTEPSQQGSVSPPMPVTPTKVIQQQSALAEYGSEKEFTFTVPSKSVPLSSHLWVKVSAEREQVGEFTLQFDVAETCPSHKEQRRVTLDKSEGTELTHLSTVIWARVPLDQRGHVHLKVNFFGSLRRLRGIFIAALEQVYR
jgi:hypothetical protein